MIRYQKDRSAISPCLISALTARKLLAKGCQGILAYVLDTKMKVPDLGEILVVKDFSYVFPEELPGLPLDREIEFSIDVPPKDTTDIYSSLSYGSVGAKGTKVSIVVSVR